MGFLDKNAPLRLLRKAWQDPNELAQELYAMFSAKGDEVEVEAPVTIKARPGQTALRIVRSDDAPPPAPQFSFGSPGRARRPPDPGPPPGPKNAFLQAEDPGRPARSAAAAPESGSPRPAVAVEDARVPAPPSRRPTDPPDRPVMDIEGAIRFRGDRPVYFDRPPLVFHDDTFRWQQVPVAVPEYPASGGGTTTYVGRVVSGSGRDYKVQLLDVGTRADTGGAAPVDVSCPAVATEEQIPAGTLLAPIFQFTDARGASYYEGYPPVWLDGSPRS